MARFYWLFIFLFAAGCGGGGGGEDGDASDPGQEEGAADGDVSGDAGGDDAVPDDAVPDDAVPDDAADDDGGELPPPPYTLEDFCPSAAGIAAEHLPALPSFFMDTTCVPPAGRTIAVEAGGDLQAAIDGAAPGDVITLPAGATFTGPFTLRNKDGDDWIVIRTGAADAELPLPGTRIGPSWEASMPKLVVTGESVVGTEPGAHHYRFIGIEMSPAPGQFLYNLVTLDGGAHHLIFDRCYLHGDPAAGTRRGIALNSAWTAVVDSTLSDFKEVGADSQALCGWDGPGPFAIVNNTLEGAAENIMFGGAVPSTDGLVPSDIEIRHNYLRKPPGWRVEDPSYEGTPWSVKNLFELKNARRVLVDGNVMEYNWAHAQSGFAVLFTVRGEDGAAPWAEVGDVVFTRNIVRHTGSGLNMHARDETPSEQTRRVLVCNNLWDDVDGVRWGGDGRLFQVLGDTVDVIIDHNTGLQGGSVIMGEGDPSTGFVYRNNIAPHNAYGVVGTGTGTGTDTLDTYYPGAIFVRNVLAGGEASLYPADNFFPATLDDVGFTDLAGGDYRLAVSSPYKGQATDGTDIGADVQALREVTSGVIP